MGLIWMIEMISLRDQQEIWSNPGLVYNLVAQVGFRMIDSSLRYAVKFILVVPSLSLTHNSTIIIIIIVIAQTGHIKNVRL